MSSAARLTFDTALLGCLHYLNYTISSLVVQDTVIPFFSRSSRANRALQTLNDGLYRSGISYKVRSTETKQESSDRYTEWRLKRDPFISATTDVLFNVTISFSLQITFIFLCDVATIMDTPVRSFDWQFTLSSLTILLSYAIPAWLTQCWLYMWKNGVKSHIVDKRKFASSYFMVLALWITILKISAVILIGSDDRMGFLQRSLYRLSFVGISCLAILNGTGCISSVFGLYNWKWKSVSRDELQRAVDSLKTTESLIESRDVGETLDSQHLDELGVLRGERKDILQRVEALVSAYTWQRGSSTLNGRIQKVFQLLFSVYCLYRVLTTFFLEFPLMLLSYLGFRNRRQADTDPLSTTIARLIVHHINNNLDVDSLSIMINMIFAIGLFVGSFQSVAVTISKASKVAWLNGSSDLKNDFRTGYFYNLFVAEVTGVYILSTMMILARGGLPSELTDRFFSSEYMSADFVNVLYQRWFDFSCTCCFVVILLMRRFEGEFVDGDGDFYDEEKLVESSRNKQL